MVVLNLLAVGLILYLSGWGAARVIKNHLAVRSVLFTPKFDCVFLGGPDLLAKHAEEWGVRHHVQQLAELGFVPLGSRVERLWGAGKDEALCWGHPTARTFASIWRFGDVPKLFFVSVCGKRLGVLTANYPRREERRTEAMVRTSVPGLIREAFATHERILQDLEAKGTKFDAGFDQAASCASSVDYFYNPDILGQYRKNLGWRIREAGIGLLALLGASVIATVVYLRN